MSNIKRLYLYGVAFAALMVAVQGLVTMVGPLVDRLLPAQLLVGGLATPFSLGLAMVIPGLPLWLLLWRATQRSLSRSPEEAGSALRKLYLNALLFISAAVTLAAAIRTLSWLLGSGEAHLDGSTLARLLVWGSLWSYHWRVESSEGQPTPASKTLRRWYVYLTSGYSLTLLVTGAGIVLAILLSGLYAAVSEATVVNGSGSLWKDQMRMGVAFVGLGWLWWSFHWLYAARGDRESVLRQVYLYLLAVLGGIVTTLITVGILLYQTLRFLLGGVTVSAAAHFHFLAGVLPALLLGMALWLYHWRVVQEEGAEVPSRLMGAGRSYRYIMAALGLASLATGTTILIQLGLSFLDLARPSDVINVGGWWQDSFSAAVAALVVGMPVWLYFWSRAQAGALEQEKEERRALPRRLFLYLVLAAALLGLLGNLSFFLFKLFNALLQGDLSLDVVRETRWSVGVATTAVVFVIYYWGILRQDQRSGVEAAVNRKEVVVLVGEAAASLLPRLEEALGGKPRVMYNLATDEEPPALSPEDLQALAERVAAAPGSRVLLVVGREGVSMYPYRS